MSVLYVLIPVLIFLLGLVLGYKSLVSQTSGQKTLEEQLKEIDKDEEEFIQKNSVDSNGVPIPWARKDRKNSVRKVFWAIKKDAIKSEQGYPILGSLLFLLVSLIGFLFTGAICLGIKYILFSQFADLCINKIQDPNVGPLACFNMFKQYTYWVMTILGGVFSLLFVYISPLYWAFSFAGASIAVYIILIS